MSQLGQRRRAARHRGRPPTEAVVDADATERLGELAASRNARDAEQAAAAQVQAEADRVAAAGRRRGGPPEGRPARRTAPG